MYRRIFRDIFHRLFLPSQGLFLLIHLQESESAFGTFLLLFQTGDNATAKDDFSLFGLLKRLFVHF